MNRISYILALALIAVVLSACTSPNEPRKEPEVENVTLNDEDIKYIQDSLPSVHVYKIKNGDLLPARIRKSATVVLMVFIDGEGDVDDVEIIESTDSRFNKNAIAAVRKYEFSPGRLGRLAIVTPMTLTVHFVPPEKSVK